MRCAAPIKIILLTFIVTALPLLGFAQSPQSQKTPLPVSTGHVNDFAAVLDKATVDNLETILRNFDERTGAQIAVVTIRTLDGRPIEDYANELYRAWGLGAKTGENKDKGALLLVATEDRKSRLEVGYGLEGDLPDGLAGEMLRRMRPYFRELKWSEGVTTGVRTLVDTLAKKWNVSLEGIDQRYAYTGSSDGLDAEDTTIMLVVAGFFLLIILWSFISNWRSPGRRGGGGWMNGTTFNTGGGWSSGSSSSSSDWGGFDGGSSGGGGASDSW